MFSIEPLQPDDWSEAMTLAFAHEPREERPVRRHECLQMLANGVLDPRGIWVARQDTVLVAVQVCVPLDGAACLFWAPSGPADAADAVVRAGVSWCRSIGCRIAQALVKPAQRHLAAPLERAGFRHITRLQQWQRDLADLPALIDPGLRFEPYRPALAAAFADTIERSYEGTLDCPELNGVRTIDEIIAGHRGQGKFHPDCWWLAWLGDQPIGVVILVEMPDGFTWELAYLGLVPEFRRRGLARALLTHALDALRSQPATHVVLAVDERNLPARRLYEAFGFVEVETNEVFLFLC